MDLTLYSDQLKMDLICFPAWAWPWPGPWPKYMYLYVDFVGKLKNGLNSLFGSIKNGLNWFPGLGLAWARALA